MKSLLIGLFFWAQFAGAADVIRPSGQNPQQAVAGVPGSYRQDFFTELDMQLGTLNSAFLPIENTPLTPEAGAAAAALQAYGLESFLDKAELSEGMSPGRRAAAEALLHAIADPGRPAAEVVLRQAADRFPRVLGELKRIEASPTPHAVSLIARLKEGLARLGSDPAKVEVGLGRLFDEAPAKSALQAPVEEGKGTTGYLRQAAMRRLGEVAYEIALEHVEGVPPERLMYGLLKESQTSPLGARALERVAEARAALPRDSELAEHKQARFMLFEFSLKSAFEKLLEHMRPLRSIQEVFEAARSMVASLGDRYTVLFDPEQMRNFERSVEGTSVRVGVIMNHGSADPRVIIDMVTAGSPAQAAGLKAGDEIFSADGKPVASRSALGLMLAGEPGTKIRLGVRRAGGVDFFLELTRAETQTPEFYARMSKKDGAGYLYLHSFTVNGDVDVLAALRALKARGMRSLILDLRYNPGGEAQAVHALATAFLKKGQVIVSETGRDGRVQSLETGEDGEFSDLPVVILVNRHSASASEVLAAALQGNGRAKLVGEPTYGKGLVQLLRRLGDGSGLKMTVQRWYTPTGNSVSDVGLAPDVEVAISEEQEEALRRVLIERLYGAGGEDSLDKDPAYQAARRWYFRPNPD